MQLNDVGLFAMAAVKLVGEETFRICRKLVDELVLVDTDAVCAAIKDVFQDTRSILEPSGRSPWPAPSYMRSANTQERDSGHRSQRREHELRPAALRRRARRDRRKARSHPRRHHPGDARQLPNSARCSASATSPNSTTVTPTRKRRRCSSAFKCTDQSRDRRSWWTSCSAASSPTLDLTDNEMAKLHLRHMVGGHAPAAKNEICSVSSFRNVPAR